MENILSLNIFSFDAVTAVILLVLSFVWFYTKGKDFIVTTVLGAYVAGTVLLLAPVMKSINLDFGLGLAEYQWKFILFLIATMIFTWMMATNGFFEPYIVPNSWELAVFVILFVGLILTIGVQMMPVDARDNLSFIINFLFNHEIIATGWLLAPMGVLLLIRGEV